MVSGERLGNDTVPVGECAGTELEISGSLAVRGVVTTDEAGVASHAVTMRDEVCGDWLQAVELGSCAASNAVEIGFAEPTSVEAGCTPTGNPLRFRCTVSVDPPQPVEVRYSRSDGIGIEAREPEREGRERAPDPGDVPGAALRLHGRGDGARPSAGAGRHEHHHHRGPRRSSSTAGWRSWASRRWG